MNIDFSNQSQVFPQVPLSQNPYLYVESSLTGSSPFDSVVLANMYTYVAIFAIGIFIIFLTFILNFAYSRKTSRPLHFYRRVSRAEGNYYAVENSTFVPFTQLVFWALLFSAIMTDIEIKSNPSLLNHLVIRSQVPFIFMFLQAHGFVCGMLVGAIVTWSEVVGKHNNSKVLPIFFNTVQLLLAILIIVVNLIFMIKADSANDNVIHASLQLADELTKAVPTWTENSPLDPGVSKSIYYSIQNIQKYSIETKTQLRNVWISWIFTCSLPLAIFIISSAVILVGVRLHIKNMTKCGFQFPSNEYQVQNPPALNNSPKGINNVQSMTGYIRNSSSTGNQRIRKSFKQLRDLERILILRITVVTIPAVAWSVCVIIIFTDLSTKKSGGLGDIGIVSTYVFPWLSIVCGSAVILSWFYFACKDWRNYRYGNNRPEKAHELLTPSSSASNKQSPNNDPVQITLGGGVCHSDINGEGLTRYKLKIEGEVSVHDHEQELELGHETGNDYVLEHENKIEQMQVQVQEHFVPSSYEQESRKRPII